MKMRKGTKEITLQTDGRSFWWANEIGEHLAPRTEKSAAIAWALQAGYMHEESRSTPLRDHFAGLALQALISVNKGAYMKSSVADAYKYADEMLKEREKC